MPSSFRSLITGQNAVYCRPAGPYENTNARNSQKGLPGLGRLPASLLRRGGFLLRDPRIDAVAQHVQRQGAGVQHLIVEGAQVEVIAQSRLGPLAQLQDFELPDLVGQSLAGPRDIAVHSAWMLVSSIFECSWK